MKSTGRWFDGNDCAKLQKLLSTKAGIKNAINGSGSTVGDVFSEYPTAITSGKSAIAQAITDKGVTTASDATFQQMADNVLTIQTGPKKGNINFQSNDGSGVIAYFQQNNLVLRQNVYGNVQIDIQSILVIPSIDSNSSVEITGDIESIFEIDNIYVGLSAKGYKISGDGQFNITNFSGGGGIN